MGTFSIWHWLVVGVVVLLLFGRGKISELMGDTAKGIKAFKRGLADDDSDGGDKKPADQQPQQPAGAIPSNQASERQPEPRS